MYIEPTDIHILITSHILTNKTIFPLLAHTNLVDMVELSVVVALLTNLTSGQANMA